MNLKKNLCMTLLLALTATTATAQVYLDPQAPIEERIKDAISRMTTHEKIQLLHAQSKFTSAGVPRLGIRQLNMDDGPHGVREELEWNTWSPAQWTNDYIVAFPSLTCLASTWNRTLSTAYGDAVSEEFAFRGKDIMLGPGVNIQRTPLNGRAFEYMGEDPFLAGEMVVPYIKAAQANGVACCLKHFVLNDQETDRFAVNVNVSERAMHEIYLAPFKKAVEQADIVLYLRDATKPGEEPDLDLSDKTVIEVYTKADLLADSSRVGGLCLSSKTGLGLDTLRKEILSRFHAQMGNPGQEDILLSNARHYEALKHVRQALDAVSQGLADGIPADLVAVDLRDALYHLGTITGEVTSDELLGNIFGRFCIGK